MKIVKEKNYLKGILNKQCNFLRKRADWDVVNNECPERQKQKAERAISFKVFRERNKQCNRCPDWTSTTFLSPSPNQSLWVLYLP